jgi:hypothetical protein
MIDNDRSDVDYNNHENYKNDDINDDIITTIYDNYIS